MTDVPVYPGGAARRFPWKRALDLTGAAIGLALGAPVLALLALGVRVSAGAPVLHVQPRVGRGGRVFDLCKFRTLPPAASAQANREWSVRAAHPFLAWMRRTGLDETPQIWNVLKGEMSFVGPRPERPYFVEKFSRELPGYRHRLDARPGITGWAQIHGLRGDTSIERRLELDLDYLRRQSLAMDVRILILTTLGLLREAPRWSADDEPRKTWPTRSTSSTF